ncbi:MAG: (5-formylfuran-3-yl)methyl phosphate synthase [Gammaproteobacteria bacterium]|nr:(5-formylfuran-3-yl)methyl phosphate synthase [Gammaproteobacteria bacterium]
MSRLLASVRSEAEAMQVLRCGADIIDCKDPADGALGALPAVVIRRIVARVAGRRPVSATAGNACNSMRELANRVAQTGDCGVDYVKVGLFSPDNLGGQLRALAPFATTHALIAVCFAELDYPPDMLPRLADCGIHGVMVDTAEKGSGSLTRRWSLGRISDFVQQSQELNLLSGVAGRVGLDDLPSLILCNADYIGFRSALCGGERSEAIDETAVLRIRRAMPAQHHSGPQRQIGSAQP